MHPPAPGHIIQCADYGGPYSGSFVPMLASVARAARDRGFGTTICFSAVARGRSWLTELDGLAPIHFIEPDGAQANLRRLRQIVDEHRGSPLVLHSHFGTFDLPAALLGLSRRQTVVLSHAHSANPRPIRLRSRAYGAVMGRAVDATICVSRDIYADARARAFPPGHLIYMPNAVDVERFGPITPAERAAARDALGVPSEARLVLHFGWDWAVKGGDRFLAAAKLMDGRADTVFMTVTEDPAFAAVQEKVGAMNVIAVRPRESINELYAAADVFVNCSPAEGMPYAILEALARGVPVVATDLPVAREVLDGLAAARIVSPEAADIAGAVEDLLALDGGDRRAATTSARERIEDSYALKSWAQSLVDLYAERLGCLR